MLSATLRILVADSDRFARIGLRTVLTSRPGWTVCAEAATGHEAVMQARDTLPDVALLGLNLFPPGGLVIARAVRAEAPSTGIVMVASRASPQLVHDVTRTGARALVLRSDTEDTLFRAVEHVHQGETHMPVSIDARPLDPASGPLSPRELEVAALIASGRGTKEIATILGVTGKTADTYRMRLMQKLGAHSIVDVMRYALRHGLLEIE